MSRSDDRTKALNDLALNTGDSRSDGLERLRKIEELRRQGYEKVKSLTDDKSGTSTSPRRSSRRSYNATYSPEQSPAINFYGSLGRISYTGGAKPKAFADETPSSTTSRHTRSSSLSGDGCDDRPQNLTRSSSVNAVSDIGLSVVQFGSDQNLSMEPRNSTGKERIDSYNEDDENIEDFKRSLFGDVSTYTNKTSPRQSDGSLKSFSLAKAWLSGGVDYEDTKIQEETGGEVTEDSGIDLNMLPSYESEYLGVHYGETFDNPFPSYEDVDSGSYTRDRGRPPMLHSFSYETPPEKDWTSIGNRNRSSRTSKIDEALDRAFSSSDGSDTSSKRGSGLDSAFDGVFPSSKDRDISYSRGARSVSGSVPHSQRMKNMEETSYTQDETYYVPRETSSPSTRDWTERSSSLRSQSGTYSSLPERKKIGISSETESKLDQLFGTPDILTKRSNVSVRSYSVESGSTSRKSDRYRIRNPLVEPKIQESPAVTKLDKKLDEVFGLPDVLSTHMYDENNDDQLQSESNTRNIPVEESSVENAQSEQSESGIKKRSHGEHRAGTVSEIKRYKTRITVSKKKQETDQTNDQTGAENVEIYQHNIPVEQVEYCNEIVINEDFECENVVDLEQGCSDTIDATENLIGHNGEDIVTETIGQNVEVVTENLIGHNGEDVTENLIGHNGEVVTENLIGHNGEDVTEDVEDIAENLNDHNGEDVTENLIGHNGEDVMENLIGHNGQDVTENLIGHNGEGATENLIDQNVKDVTENVIGHDGEDVATGNMIGHDGEDVVMESEVSETEDITVPHIEHKFHACDHSEEPALEMDISQVLPGLAVNVYSEKEGSEEEKQIFGTIVMDSSDVVVEGCGQDVENIEANIPDENVKEVTLEDENFKDTSEKTGDHDATDSTQKHDSNPVQSPSWIRSTFSSFIHGFSKDSKENGTVEIQQEFEEEINVEKEDPTISQGDVNINTVASSDTGTISEDDYATASDDDDDESTKIGDRFYEAIPSDNPLNVDNPHLNMENNMTFSTMPGDTMDIFGELAASTGVTPADFEQVQNSEDLVRQLKYEHEKDIIEAKKEDVSEKTDEIKKEIKMKADELHITQDGESVAQDKPVVKQEEIVTEQMKETVTASETETSVQMELRPCTSEMFAQTEKEHVSTSTVCTGIQTQTPTVDQWTQTEVDEAKTQDLGVQVCPDKVDNGSQCDVEMKDACVQIEFVGTEQIQTVFDEQKHVLDQVAPEHVVVPEQVTPEHLVPEHLVPEQVAPEHLVPEHLVPEQVAPEHLVPEQMAPEHLVPEQVAPEHLVPEQVAPEHLVPEQVAPEHLVPEHLVPEQVAPEHLVPEQVTPEHLVPEHLVPEQVAPEHLVPEQVTPEHLVPEHLVPEQVAPEHLVPEQMAPEHLVPDQMAPEHLVPEQVAHEHLVPEQMAPEHLVTEQMAPEHLVPEQMAPEHLVPEQMAPEHLVPEQVAPEHLVPEQVAPEYLVSEQMAPEHLVPEQMAPEHLVPEQVAPEQVTPEHLVPEQMTPENRVPEQVAPEHLVPEHLVPEQMAPEQVTPENLVPEQGTPENVRPEEVRAEHFVMTQDHLVPVEVKQEHMVPEHVTPDHEHIEPDLLPEQLKGEQTKLNPEIQEESSVMIENKQIQGSMEVDFGSDIEVTQSKVEVNSDSVKDSEELDTRKEEYFDAKDDLTTKSTDDGNENLTSDLESKTNDSGQSQMLYSGSGSAWSNVITTPSDVSFASTVKEKVPPQPLPKRYSKHGPSKSSRPSSGSDSNGFNFNASEQTGSSLESSGFNFNKILTTKSSAGKEMSRESGSTVNFPLLSPTGKIPSGSVGTILSAVAGSPGPLSPVLREPVFKFSEATDHIKATSPRSLLPSTPSVSKATSPRSPLPSTSSLSKATSPRSPLPGTPSVTKATSPRSPLPSMSSLGKATSPRSPLPSTPSVTKATSPMSPLPSMSSLGKATSPRSPLPSTPSVTKATSPRSPLPSTSSLGKHGNKGNMKLPPPALLPKTKNASQTQAPAAPKSPALPTSPTSPKSVEKIELMQEYVAVYAKQMKMNNGQEEIVNEHINRLQDNPFIKKDSCVKKGTQGSFSEKCEPVPMRKARPLSTGLGPKSPGLESKAFKDFPSLRKDVVGRSSLHSNSLRSEIIRQSGGRSSLRNTTSLEIVDPKSPSVESKVTGDVPSPSKDVVVGFDTMDSKSLRSEILRQAGVRSSLKNTMPPLEIVNTKSPSVESKVTEDVPAPSKDAVVGLDTLDSKNLRSEILRQAGVRSSLKNTMPPLEIVNTKSPSVESKVTEDVPAPSKDAVVGLDTLESKNLRSEILRQSATRSSLRNTATNREIVDSETIPDSHKIASAANGEAKFSSGYYSNVKDDDVFSKESLPAGIITLERENPFITSTEDGFQEEITSDVESSVKEDTNSSTIVETNKSTDSPSSNERPKCVEITFDGDTVNTVTVDSVEEPRTEDQHMEVEISPTDKTDGGTPSVCAGGCPTRASTVSDELQDQGIGDVIEISSELDSVQHSPTLQGSSEKNIETDQDQVLKPPENGNASPQHASAISDPPASMKGSKPKSSNGITPTSPPRSKHRSNSGNTTPSPTKQKQPNGSSSELPTEGKQKLPSGGISPVAKGGISPVAKGGKLQSTTVQSPTSKTGDKEIGKSASGVSTDSRNVRKSLEKKGSVSSRSSASSEGSSSPEKGTGKKGQQESTPSGQAGSKKTTSGTEKPKSATKKDKRSQKETEGSGSKSKGRFSFLKGKKSMDARYEGHISPDEVRGVAVEDDENDVQQSRINLRDWDPSRLLADFYRVKLAKEDDDMSHTFVGMEGVMEKLPMNKKKSTLLKTWKRRFFRAKDGWLLYFETSNRDRPSDTVQLMGGRIDDLGNRILGIDDGRGRYLMVRCPTEKEYGQWKLALESQTVDNVKATYVRPLLLSPPNPQKKVILIDIGSCSIRAGILGQQASLPQMFFPSVVAVNKDTGDIKIGIEAYHPDVRKSSTLMKAVRPTSKVDKDHMKAFNVDTEVMPAVLEKIFSNLKVEPSEYWIMLSTPQNLADQLKAALFEIFIGQFHVKGLCMVMQSLLALYSYQKTSGILVDIGHRMEILPIYEGYVIDGGVTRQSYGGQKVADSLNNSLTENKYVFVTPVEQLIVRHVMEQSCYVAEDYEEVDRECTANPESCQSTVYLDQYNLPEDAHMSVTHDRSCYHSPEGFFNTELWGMDYPCVHNLIFKAIQFCPIDSRKQMYRSVYLSGGVTMLPGFAERLQKELVKLAPPSVIIEVHAAPQRYHAAYIGACSLANMDMFEQSCITGDEWARNGVKAFVKWAMK